jgi:hypothetical protein
MSSYSQPSDNDFIGSAAKRNESTQHYETFNIPQLTSIGDRSVIPTSYGRTVIRYTMTHGVLYNSFNKAFQMFFSPVSYPMVGSTVRSSQTEGDYWCRLTDNPDYQDVYNTDLFFRHSTPGFKSPVIKLPGYTGYTINNGTITPTYIRRTTEYTPAALTSDSVRIPYMTGLEQRSPAYLRYSTLGARANFTYSGSAANYTINFHDSRPDQSGDSCFTGFLQPKVSYHEKYLQSIDSAVSMCTTTLVSSMGTGSPQGFSGRYKFAGFKGKISLFETGN